MPTKVPLSSVSITEVEIERVMTALQRSEVSGTAPGVAELESALCRLTGSAHAIALNSGTSALEVALYALQLPPRSGVIVPGLTFAAPASAIIAAGHRPMICDVDEATWTLDVCAVAQMVREGARAILAVDVMGNPCSYDVLRSFGLPIIQDAAEAFGANYKGEVAGTSGTVGTLSFHANKTVSGGEGGALLTADGALADRARLIVNHGMGPGYRHHVAGRNLRMANLTACLVFAQCSRSLELVQRRQDVATLYKNGLSDLPLTWQQSTEGAGRTTWLATVRTSMRDELVAVLNRNGIDARAIWPSLESQPFLSSYSRPCPVASGLSRELLWLPTYFDLGDEVVGDIVAVIRDFFESRA